MLSIPFYDGGMRYGVSREREASDKEARAQLEATLRQVSVEVRTAFRVVANADKSLRSARQAAAAATSAAALADKSYRGGAADIEVVDAERRAHDAASAVALAEDAARPTGAPESPGRHRRLSLRREPGIVAGDELARCIIKGDAVLGWQSRCLHCVWTRGTVDPRTDEHRALAPNRNRSRRCGRKSPRFFVAGLDVFRAFDVFELARLVTAKVALVTLDCEPTRR